MQLPRKKGRPNMTEKKRDIPWLEKSTLDNLHNFPQDEKAKYAGMYIAYSWDGTRILAGAPTREALEEQLQAAGIDCSRVIHSYVDEDVG
jgi:hypothetical protein